MAKQTGNPAKSTGAEEKQVSGERMAARTTGQVVTMGPARIVEKQESSEGRRARDQENGKLQAVNRLYRAAELALKGTIHVYASLQLDSQKPRLDCRFLFQDACELVSFLRIMEESWILIDVRNLPHGSVPILFGRYSSNDALQIVNSFAMQLERFITGAEEAVWGKDSPYVADLAGVFKKHSLIDFQAGRKWSLKLPPEEKVKDWAATLRKSLVNHWGANRNFRVPQHWQDDDAFFQQYSGVFYALQEQHKRVVEQQMKEGGDSNEDYMPAKWFKQQTGIPDTRLRKESGRGNLPTQGEGKRKRYHVPTAKQLWPEDFVALDT